MLAPHQLPWLDLSRLTIHQKQTTAPFKPTSCSTKLIPPGTFIFAFWAAGGFKHVSASFELQVSRSQHFSLTGFELATLWTPCRSSYFRSYQESRFLPEFVEAELVSASCQLKSTY